MVEEGFVPRFIDGQPGPSTSDAIARFQQREDLPVSGRLDEETLDALRALPGQRNGPPARSTYAPRDHQQTLDGEPVYRGVPVEGERRAPIHKTGRSCGHRTGSKVHAN